MRLERMKRMKKIAIELHFEDNQYDVLVHDETGMRDEELTDYAFESKTEAENYINALKNLCIIETIEEVNGDEETTPYTIDEFITPRFLTYVLSETQLQPTLEELFFKKNGFRIPISVTFDSESIYIKLDERASERLKKHVADMYRDEESFKQALLDDVFNGADVQTSVPMDDFSGIHILVPYRSKRTP